MKTDTRLSSMLHLLLHMAHAEGPLTSEALARMLQTNPVLVRRTLAGLRERDLVSSEKGHGGGWHLARPLETITLYDVYEALGAPELFAIGHRRAPSPCLVEKAVTTALDRTLAEAEALVFAQLREVTLAVLSDEIHRRQPRSLRGSVHGHDSEP
jgi:Rrf2 family protein